MADKTKEIKETKDDVLDQFKKAEKMIKTNLLLKSIGNLKKLAREVLEIKEETRIMLSEIGISEEDSKRVIDFINSLVELSEADKKEIRDEVKKGLASDRKEIEKKVEESPLFFGSNSGSVNAYYSASGTGLYTTTTGSNDITLTANGATTTISV